MHQWRTGRRTKANADRDTSHSKVTTPLDNDDRGARRGSSTRAAYFHTRT